VENCLNVFAKEKQQLVFFVLFSYKSFSLQRNFCGDFQPPPRIIHT